MTPAAISAPAAKTAPKIRFQLRGRNTPTTSTKNDPPSRIRIGTRAAQSISGFTKSI